jgi:hypothetical protein
MTAIEHNLLVPEDSRDLTMLLKLSIEFQEAIRDSKMNQEEIQQEFNHGMERIKARRENLKALI